LFSGLFDEVSAAGASDLFSRGPWVAANSFCFGSVDDDCANAVPANSVTEMKVSPTKYLRRE
jgi:hypothetical protein